MAYPRTGDYPEALIKILITIMDKTSDGGATMEDLKDVYQDIRGNVPSNKTIYRAIRRLNLIFDPLAYGETSDEDDELSPEELLPPVIQAHRVKGITRYLYTGELWGTRLDANQALLMTIGLYTQQRGLLKDHFESVISELLRDLLVKISALKNTYKEVEQYVYISGFGPADPPRSIARIREIMRAIRLRKRVRLEYLRSYDGATTKREVEPYGLICRSNNWYLVAFCLQRQGRRVFLLDHIKRMDLVEASLFKWPEEFSLHDVYKHAWGVWTQDSKETSEPEVVCLKINKGIAERFKLVNFHDSQQIRSLPGDEIEVTYRVTGAREMLPWLMSWGAAIEVQKPEWLREALASGLREMLSVYG